MQRMLSPEMTTPLHTARAAVAHGLPIPVSVALLLEAQGVNVGELEEKLKHEFEHLQGTRH